MVSYKLALSASRKEIDEIFFLANNFLYQELNISLPLKILKEDYPKAFEKHKYANRQKLDVQNYQRQQEI